MPIPDAPPLSSFLSVSSASAFSFVFSGPVANASSKRTNSLGFAASDCHTCQSLKQQCDRQRPRCNMCTTSGVHCHGYAQKLAWQSGLASRGKMTRKTFNIPAHDEPANHKRKTRCPTTFAFVQENGIKRRKTKPQAQATGEAFAPTRRRPKDISSPKAQSPTISTTPEIGRTLEAAASPVTHQSLEEYSPIVMEQPQRHINDPVEVAETPESLDSPTTPNSPPSDQHDMVIHRKMTTFYPLHHHESEILDFYKWRFSMLPITFEMQVNPWQMCLPMAFESPCLMNAVFALGKKYRGLLMHEAEDVEALQFKNKSLNAFIVLVQDLTATPALLIATILALVAIDVSTAPLQEFRQIY